MGVLDRRRRHISDGISSDGSTTAEDEGSPAGPEPSPERTGLDPLIERIGALTVSVEKTFAEALQTGDFVRQIQRTLGDGIDAIRAQAVDDAVEALLRAHSAVALRRIEAEARGDEERIALLRDIEAEVDAELAFVGITPLIPGIGDPIDTRTMRTKGDIPDGTDHATALKTVAGVSACGYQLPGRRILPTVTVRWHAASETDPQP